MTPPLTQVVASRLEKSALDNGFDRELPRLDDWLVFASTQCPLQVWLGSDDGRVHAAFSRQNVVDALGDHGEPITATLPQGSCGGRTAGDIPTLHHLLRRAFQLSRSLPNELLHTFEMATATLPRSTEVERTTIQRVGQDIFRSGLLDYWEGRCAISGLAIPELLRASHVKPWAGCDSDAERLDIFNGLLLAVHFDAAFDKGFFTFADDGTAIVSDDLPLEARRTLGLDRSLAVALAHEHARYLVWHREHVFRKLRLNRPTASPG